MVFTVRCYKCSADAVRLVLGGRAILHARCHACGTNLLAEVLAFEEETLTEHTDTETEAQSPFPESPMGELLETGAE